MDCGGQKLPGGRTCMLSRSSSVVCALCQQANMRSAACRALNATPVQAHPIAA